MSKAADIEEKYLAVRKWIDDIKAENERLSAELIKWQIRASSLMQFVPGDTLVGDIQITKQLIENNLELLTTATNTIKNMRENIETLDKMLDAKNVRIGRLDDDVRRLTNAVQSRDQRIQQLLDKIHVLEFKNE